MCWAERMSRGEGGPCTSPASRRLWWRWLCWGGVGDEDEAEKGVGWVVQSRISAAPPLCHRSLSGRSLSQNFLPPRLAATRAWTQLEKYKNLGLCVCWSVFTTFWAQGACKIAFGRQTKCPNFPLVLAWILYWRSIHYTYPQIDIVWIVGGRLSEAAHILLSCESGWFILHRARGSLLSASIQTISLHKLFIEMPRINKIWRYLLVSCIVSLVSCHFCIFWHRKAWQEMSRPGHCIFPFR